MVLKLREMCDPAHLVLMIGLLGIVVEILRTKRFTGDTIMVLLGTLLFNMYLAILDVFCKTGHKSFAWALVTLSILIFIGVDKLLQRGWDGLFFDKTQKRQAELQARPYNS